jgi:hypothetical protein
VDNIFFHSFVFIRFGYSKKRQKHLSRILIHSMVFILDLRERILYL